MQTNEQIAVFLDIENFIGFSNTLKLPIDLSEILEKLKEEGRIIIRRSFGDLIKALAAIGQIKESDNVRRMLRDNLFIHEDIAYQNQFKNSADMRLAVEMLYTAFTVPNISKFVVISGDSDYVPLFQKLQEQNKTVIGISGSENSTAVIYRRACDSIYYFEDIMRRTIGEISLEENGSSAIPKAGESLEKDLSKVRNLQNIAAGTTQLSPDAVSANGLTSTQTSAQSQIFVPAAPHDYQSLRDEYANLLVRAVRILNDNGNTSTIQALSVQMRQLQSDFNYERAGFETLQNLVRFAAERNLVAVEQRDKIFTVYLPEAKPLSSQAVSTAHYRKHLQDRIKCQLPASHIRKAICEQAFNTISFNIDDGGILLRDLSMDVTDELSSKNLNVPQPEVYKYLYSLFRSRCFSFENSDFGDFNPFITGFNAQTDEWDDRFIVVQTRQLSQENLPIFPQKLSSLFFESEEKTMHIKQLLNKHSIKYEKE